MLARLASFLGGIGETLKGLHGTTGTRGTCRIILGAALATFGGQLLVLDFYQQVKRWQKATPLGAAFGTLSAKVQPAYLVALTPFFKLSRQAPRGGFLSLRRLVLTSSTSIINPQLFRG
jgi:hypothetical protein